MAVNMDDMTAELEMMECEIEARRRYSQSESYQAMLASRYRQTHLYVFPPTYGNGGSGDQWPGDRMERPDKLHVTVNYMKAFAMSSARLEAMLPRFTIPSTTLPEPVRRRAEATEQLMSLWLDMSGIDVWMFDLCLTKGMYGKGVIKTLWNKQEKRGDCIVIEQPHNLRIGWGSSDFTVKDWALYEYKLSPEEIERRWPQLELRETGDKAKPIDVMRMSSHSDPLAQKVDTTSQVNTNRLAYHTQSEYEQLQIPVWDYWYREEGGEGDEPAGIYNCIIVGGTCVEPAKRHPELLDIPYIVIEHDHEPGSPEGVSGIQDLADLQIELNRLYSHGFQYVADNVDPAWYIKGEDAAGLPEGIIPKAGEATNLGNSDIIEVPKGGANTFPITELIDAAVNAMHRISGMPEIGLGGMASSDISGRAVAVQIQSHANRMEQRRNRLYRGLKDLLRSWVYMAEKVNPQLAVDYDEQGQPIKRGLKEMVGGFYNWKVIPPEITPRDAQEAVTVEINKVNATLQSKRTAMDNIGIENPEAEIDMIREETVDAMLSPERAQLYLALFPLMQQIQAQQQAMQQQLSAMGQQNPAAQNPAAQAQAAGAQAQQQQFAAQPTGFEDQNQPMTQPGMPPPGNGQGPNATTLIRPGQAMNQLAFTQQGG